MSKKEEYAVKIMTAVAELFNVDNDNYIDLEEFGEGDNATDFTHALANIVPTKFYNKLTSSELNLLEFNHLANQLVFQNININSKK